MRINALNDTTINNKDLSPLFKGANVAKNPIYCGLNNERNFESDSFSYSKKTAKMLCSTVACLSLVLATFLLFCKK